MDWEPSEENKALRDIVALYLTDRINAEAAASEIFELVKGGELMWNLLALLNSAVMPRDNHSNHGTILCLLEALVQLCGRERMDEALGKQYVLLQMSSQPPRPVPLTEYRELWGSYEKYPSNPEPTESRWPIYEDFFQKAEEKGLVDLSDVFTRHGLLSLS